MTIPREIREELGIAGGSLLEWSVGEGFFVAAPVSDGPVAASKGAFKEKGPSVEDVLEERREELSPD